MRFVPSGAFVSRWLAHERAREITRWNPVPICGNRPPVPCHLVRKDSRPCVALPSGVISTRSLRVLRGSTLCGLCVESSPFNHSNPQFRARLSSVLTTSRAVLHLPLHPRSEAGQPPRHVPAILF